ncbi:hypothetical protein LIA77_05771 [Sarocladium implicatum]|nr:hypothetical protein LIA77_05771 [Sarocladium implicatum]
MPPPKGRVAYVEEAPEDTGSSIEGDENTRQYATTPSQGASTSERPNTSRTRETRAPPGSSGSSSAGIDDTDTSSVPRSSQQNRPPKLSVGRREMDQRQHDQVKRERQRPDAKERSSKPEVPRATRTSQTPRKTRPPLPQHAASQPIIHHQSGYPQQPIDNPSYYGMQQPAVSGPARPGARRPASYYAGQPAPRPPMSNPSWHPAPPYPVVGTFPPPMSPMYPSSPMMHAPMAPPPPPAPIPVESQDYFDAPHQARDRLKARFQRPASAMGGGGRPPPVSYVNSEHEGHMGQGLARRPSQSGRRERERDKQDMPPPTWIPRRPSSAMPTASPFHPPPQPQTTPLRQQRSSHANRRSVGFVDQPRRGFADEDLLPDDGHLFQDLSPQPSYDPPRGNRSRLIRGSVSYDNSDYELVPAKGRNSRRSSMHGTAALEQGSIEDVHLEAALRYQDRMSGGKVQMPLTAKTLHEANRREGVASSRSTRSSASHDDSEYYKRSSTTGVTRSSGGGGEDYTIKLSGAAVVRASGLEIECEGGEITFSAPSRSRSGSDRGSTIFPQQIEDSHSRLDRRALPHRARAPSQSDSQSRGYAPTYAPYDPHLTTGEFF